MNCHHCQGEVVLPFRCPYCHQQFCSEHRLPENHSCPEYWRVMTKREEATPVTVETPTTTQYEFTTRYTQSSPSSRAFQFSLRELKHLAIGSLLVTGVGLSMRLMGFIRGETLVGLALVLTLSFILHELAHKLTAQRYGLWAEFRLTPSGALITLLSMVLPSFKIISPGAVMIMGHATRDVVGKTALSGSLVNIVLSIFFIGAASTTSPLPTGLVSVAVFGAWINAFISTFNLIPLGMLDGLKVLSWNKAVWLGAFMMSFLLAAWIYISWLG
ncbi:MAG: hypothetical protein JSV58_00080 [Candidatus Bathyarchaeota archaeon]|nr:MAG: hypothetical protein JSV58_00080 [Candidatus Bathyarchaeota archaeon]